MNKNAVILIPCYDPDEKIMEDFLKQLTKKFANIVFIDDGCSKEHKAYLKKLAEKYPMITHNVNLGKGRGIKNGINYILNNYPKAKSIVMADCDGQHGVDDIEKCLKVSLKYPDALVLGCRNFDEKDVPFKSRYGNKITRNILNMFVGEKISDTQTGLRAMSLDVARELIEVPGERYEYETNVFMAVKDKNIPIKEVGIKTIYIENNRTSHFNPVKDSIRIYKFFAKYLMVSFFAFIIEILIFAGLLKSNLNIPLEIPLFLLLAELVSSTIVLSINNYISISSRVITYIVNVIVLCLLSTQNINLVLIKVLIDIFMFIINLLFTNFNIEKEA